jgi:hypothetical protein
MGKISSQTLRRLTNRLSTRDSVTERAPEALLDIAGSGGHSSWAR